MESDRTSPASQARGAQIIAAALMLGVLTFAAISVFLVEVQHLPAARTGAMMSIGLAVFAGTCLMMAVWVSAALATTAVKDQSDDGLIQGWQSRIIIRFALCEAACFANLVGYIVEQNWWSLAVVAGLLVFMLTMFPTRTQLEQFIETQRAFR